MDLLPPLPLDDRDKFACWQFSRIYTRHNSNLLVQLIEGIGSGNSDRIALGQY